MLQELDILARLAEVNARELRPFAHSERVLVDLTAQNQLALFEVPSDCAAILTRIEIISVQQSDLAGVPDDGGSSSTKRGMGYYGGTSLLLKVNEQVSTIASNHVALLDELFYVFEPQARVALVQTADAGEPSGTWGVTTNMTGFLVPASMASMFYRFQVEKV